MGLLLIQESHVAEHGTKPLSSPVFERVERKSYSMFGENRGSKAKSGRTLYSRSRARSERYIQFVQGLFPRSDLLSTAGSK